MVLEIDIQGAEIVREKVPDAISVFILPPSYAELADRLSERGTEGEESLNVRLKNARNEVKAAELFDYVVVNDDLAKAVVDMIAIFRAERLRRDRQTALIRDILISFDAED